MASPMLAAVGEVVRRNLYRDGTCPACTPHGTIEEGPAGATWTVSCRHGGVRQRCETPILAFLEAQDRDALADVVSKALGAQAGVHRAASRKVVDALLDGP